MIPAWWLYVLLAFSAVAIVFTGATAYRRGYNVGQIRGRHDVTDSRYRHWAKGWLDRMDMAGGPPEEIAFRYDEIKSELEDGGD